MILDFFQEEGGGGWSKALRFWGWVLTVMGNGGWVGSFRAKTVSTQKSGWGPTVSTITPP